MLTPPPRRNQIRFDSIRLDSTPAPKRFILIYKRKIQTPACGQFGQNSNTKNLQSYRTKENRDKKRATETIIITVIITIIIKSRLWGPSFPLEKYPHVLGFLPRRDPCTPYSRHPSRTKNMAPCAVFATYLAPCRRQWYIAVCVPHQPIPQSAVVYPALVSGRMKSILLYPRTISLSPLHS